MPKNEGQKPASLGAYLFAELRHAFQDMRQKVIEEGWFGRVVTAAPVIEADTALGAESAYDKDRRSVFGDDSFLRNASATDAPSFDERWATRDHAPAETPHDQDLGIDR